MKYDVIIIGGGLSGITAGVQLQKSGKRTLVVAFGLSLHETERSEYVALGGYILPGDKVTAGNFNGDTLVSVKTQKLGSTLLEADSFILCTGKFFSKGLVSTMDTVYEPIFGCDVDYIQDSTQWAGKNFFDKQPFMSFGVKTDADGRVSVNGKVIRNLYAAGEILAGDDVDIVESALKVCKKLI